MAWAVSNYSKGEINRAGRVLIDPDASHDARMHALDAMSSWRAAQAYPMHALLMMLRRKSADIEGTFCRRCKGLLFAAGLGDLDAI